MVLSATSNIFLTIPGMVTPSISQGSPCQCFFEEILNVQPEPLETMSSYFFASCLEEETKHNWLHPSFRAAEL